MCLSNPVARVSRSETARASVGAQTGNAFPGPGFCSQRARDFGPAGWWRRPRTAAAEKAPFRYAWPLGVPAGPYRFPADSLAPRVYS